jgi:hypothetical protein
MSDMPIQIYSQNWYKVETHSIPDKKEVENLTDFHVDATQLMYYGLTNIRLQRQTSLLAEL